MNVMTNQVDQFYVVDDNHALTIDSTRKGDVYFTYAGAKGTLRSDLIVPGQVMDLKLTDAEAQATTLKEYVVTLTSNAGAPIIGQDYQVKIAISQFQDLAEDSVYYKYGFVHVTSATNTLNTFMRAMAKSLIANFSREITKFFDFGVVVGNTVTICDTVADVDAVSGNVTAVVIRELAQDWNLGLMPKTGVNFIVYTDEILIDGVYETWGTAEARTSTAAVNSIANGYTIADMEYFYMGERGDQYRMFAQPQDRIPTKLLVNPELSYDVVNVHYYFVDSLGGAQKSEKDITIVVPTTATVTAASIANDLAEALGMSSYTHVETTGVSSETVS